jgi:hypothetical protein
LKNEVASELGIPDYNKIDKGSLPFRVHGYVGGNMVRKMVKAYENAASNGGTLKVDTDVSDIQNSLQADEKQVQTAMQGVQNSNTMQ